MGILIERDRTPVASLMPSRKAFDLCRQFEGLSLTAYPDPATGGDPWTIGYGHTRGVTRGMVIDNATAERFLLEDLAEAAGIIRANVTVPLTQGEMDGLCSLVLNLGKIPRSLLACLNGGRVDTGQEMAPGSYGSAMRQFVRNCRAAGKPMLGLYRRRLAECCVYSGLPFENAASVNLVRLKILPNGAIDPNESTTLEETLERAMRDIPVDTGPKPDFSKPFPPIAQPTIADDTLPEPEPVHIPHPDAEIFEEDPPIPSTPAAPSPATDTRATAGASAPTIAPVVVSAPAPIPNPAVLPPVVSDPGPEAPAIKDMVKSRRYWGQFLQSFGHIFQTIGVTGPIGAGPLAVGFGKAYGVVVRDPFLFEMVITVAIFTTGWALTHVGGWVKKFGEKHAKSPLGTSREVAVQQAAS